MQLSYDVEIPATGLNLDLPPGNYLIHSLSAFGPWLRIGPSAGEGAVDAEAADFFDDPYPESIPGAHGHLPGRAVTITEEVDRLALRTHAGEVGDFKQRHQSAAGGENATLRASTFIRIESPVPFAFVEEENGGGE